MKTMKSKISCLGNCVSKKLLILFLIGVFLCGSVFAMQSRDANKEVYGSWWDNFLGSFMATSYPDPSGTLWKCWDYPNGRYTPGDAGVNYERHIVLARGEQNSFVCNYPACAVQIFPGYPWNCSGSSCQIADSPSMVEIAMKQGDYMFIESQICSNVKDIDCFPKIVNIYPCDISTETCTPGNSVFGSACGAFCGDLDCPSNKVCVTRSCTGPQCGLTSECWTKRCEAIDTCLPSITCWYVSGNKCLSSIEYGETSCYAGSYPSKPECETHIVQKCSYIEKWENCQPVYKEQNEPCPANAIKPSECNGVPTCSDGIQNQGETGIDCGGPCDSCVSPACEDKSDGTSCGTDKFCYNEGCISKCSGFTDYTQAFYPGPGEQCAAGDKQITVNAYNPNHNCWSVTECVWCTSDDDCDALPHVKSATCIKGVGKGYCKLDAPPGGCDPGYKYDDSVWWTKVGCVQGDCDTPNTKKSCLDIGCYWVTETTPDSCKDECPTDVAPSTMSLMATATGLDLCPVGTVPVKAHYDKDKKCWQTAGCRKIEPKEKCSEYKSSTECFSDDRCFFVDKVCLENEIQNTLSGEELRDGPTTAVLKSSLCSYKEQCKKEDFDKVKCINADKIEEDYDVDVPRGWYDFMPWWLDIIAFVPEPDIGVCVGEGGGDLCDLPLECVNIGGYDVPVLFLLGGVLIFVMIAMGGRRGI